MRISDWSSDVCSSDLHRRHGEERLRGDRDPAAGLRRRPQHRPGRRSHAVLAEAGMVGDRGIPVRRGKHAGPGGRGLRWVGDRVNDTTERQRVTAPGDPSPILDEQITATMELDSYGALALYAGSGQDAWSVRAYVHTLATQRP